MRQDVRDFTVEEQLRMILRNGNLIQGIENPCEEVQIAAVQKNGNTIKWIKNPSEKIQLVAIKHFPLTIQYINNPTLRVQIKAAKHIAAIYSSERKACELFRPQVVHRHDVIVKINDIHPLVKAYLESKGFKV